MSNCRARSSEWSLSAQGELADNEEGHGDESAVQAVATGFAFDCLQQAVESFLDQRFECGVYGGSEPVTFAFLRFCGGILNSYYGIYVKNTNGINVMVRCLANASASRADLASHARLAAGPEQWDLCLDFRW